MGHFSMENPGQFWVEINNLRLPALAKLLRADDGGPGLLSVLEGSASLDEAIFKDAETGLNVLMTKPSEPRSNINAADILSSHKFQALIAELKARYDLVILDTPPVLVVTDARILAREADAVVYVVRWDNTPRGAVTEGLKELKSVNAPIAGLALTLVDESRASRYSYEGYSYYKGRYKDYYVS
ncbi:MAG: CpsD/CapB family tyrosine-protein kinase [Rhodobacteraceae bacterium]|nr:CpsD/CapB family tyrosine-protein kinase [Paracoccaceae bacterium]